jgi:hypothetical protein
MVLTKEDRIALLEKARAVKANKKAERDAEKPIPKKGRPPSKKPESKLLDLGDVADESNVEELAEDIKKIEINKEEPAIEPELPQEEEEQEIEIVEEIIKKKKKPKKKIIRRYIEPSSSEDEQEIIEEFIKKKPKQKTKLSPRYEPYGREEPTPIQLTPPTLNLFCY